MPLPNGTRIGPYEVLSPLGAGGMGEVYRARDSRLSREVALKLLPEEFAADPERLARFGREAQILASLNHPHIAAIHGMEESSGAPCLVLELVPGQTLAERLQAGPMPVRETLEVAAQIAEALEAAHERGIIHRDLKPANVKITPDGTVKVLDFGLAKAIETSAGPGAAAGAGVAVGQGGGAKPGAGAGNSPPPVSQSPTLTLGATARGIILGTAAYMSPEQARGQAVDRRADIWSFGCVLYELLCGRPAFGGETISDTLAAVLKSEPEWDALPADTPAAIRRLLRRCFERDARRRLRDIGDARIEIEELLSKGSMREGSGESDEARGNTSARRARWLWLSSGTAAGVALAILASPGWWSARFAPAQNGKPIRMEITLPFDQTLVFDDYTNVALSPDGSALVYVGYREGPQLFLRSFEEHGARAIAGTEGGYGPFFSPDSEWIGFFDLYSRKLKKIRLEGGSPETICEGINVSAASWGEDDTIVFTTWPAGDLMQVAAEGGRPERLVASDVGGRRRLLMAPVHLPGGGAILAGVVGSDRSEPWIAAFPTPQSTVLKGEKEVLRGSAFVRFVPPGTLLFARPSGDLLAAPFDPTAAEVTGQAIPVLEGVRVEQFLGNGQIDVAGESVLAYVRVGASGIERELVWVDRNGNERLATSTRRAWCDPNLSPDGRRVALGIQDPQQDLWILDLERDTMTRATSDPDPDMAPVWSPDGMRLVYARGARHPELFGQLSDGSGEVSALLRSEEYALFPVSWSRDGAWMALWGVGGESGGLDILTFRFGRDPKAQKLLSTPFAERHPQISPDGKWLAYTSNESGRDEIYVREARGAGSKTQISSDGGHEPRWARSGRELYYRSRDRLMAVPVRAEGGSSFGMPKILFRGRYADPGAVIDYDVSPDGQRFLMIKDVGEQPLSQIHVVFNWAEDLKRRQRAGAP